MESGADPVFPVTVEPDHPQALPPLPDFSGLRVLVVGDVMLDRYWFGSVDRISPEAPVPVVSVRETEVRCGGAANVVANVASLGARATILSVIGDDEAGRILCGLLELHAIDARLRVDPGSRTTEKLRIVARNQQLVRADFEQPPTTEMLARCMDDFRAAAGDVDAVVISDYGKGGLVHVAEMIALAGVHGVPVVVDPKGRDFSRYSGATVITPNQREFELVTGIEPDSESFVDGGRRLVEALAVEALLVTRSERGMTLIGRAGEVVESPARAREVYDVSGAGDTVVAAVALGLAAGMEWRHTLALANLAAGIVVGRLGTAAITREEIEAAWTPAAQP
jgi:rfaE bifunctional protein kinase chain/domain